MTVKSIKIQNNKIIRNKKGNILKFLNCKSKQFKGFGELYFSEIKKKHQKDGIFIINIFHCNSSLWISGIYFFNPKK